MKVQRRERVRVKQTPQFNTTTEQQAQLNLIQISNAQFNSDLLPNFKQPSLNDVRELKLDKSHMKIRIKQKNMPLLKILHRSTDLKQSVADKLTESYRAGRRASCSQLNTDQVCVITRKLPLSLSSFMVLDTQKKPINHIQYQSPSYKPKPCINTKTYFKKRSYLKNQDKSNQAYQTPRYQARKLYPNEQTYWKIYRGTR